MDKNELNKILENHYAWLVSDYKNGNRANLRDADLRSADLRDADLRSADLRDADLRDADLRDADLIGADLRGTDLRGANLRSADLICADLRDADLRSADLRDADLICANLIGADLRGTDLRGANLRSANLICADLRDADLRDADLRDADLIGADLRDADLRDATNIPFIPYACPDTGSFIGYKKAGNYIIKLEILSDARRCSATGRKCRCDKAKVLEIQNMDSTLADIDKIASNYDKNFIYKTGDIAKEPNFCEDRWNECSAGIHFFINRQEAVNYFS